MKRLLVVSLTMAALFGSSTLAAAQQCRLFNFAQLPPTTLALGQVMYFYAVNYPEVAQALVSARDAWDSTHAIDRIGEWNGQFMRPDCPNSQSLQVGAFDFNDTSCSTINAYRNAGFLPPSALAFVDYYGFVCPGCGTKSLTLNLAVAWSVNPGPMQYDLQGVLTHEFGHMLGLAHMNGFKCEDSFAPNCALYSDRNTMTANIPDGDTCERTLSGIDVGNANSLY